MLVRKWATLFPEGHSGKASLPNVILLGELHTVRCRTHTTEQPSQRGKMAVKNEPRLFPSTFLVVFPSALSRWQGWCLNFKRSQKFAFSLAWTNDDVSSARRRSWVESCASWRYFRSRKCLDSGLQFVESCQDIHFFLRHSYTAVQSFSGTVWNKRNSTKPDLQPCRPET